MKFHYLDLSTGHVSKETMTGLSNSSCTGITIANYDYGVFVSVPGEDEGIDELECPEDLKVVLRFAKAEGCHLVRFDSDAGTVPNLPSFDW